MPQPTLLMALQETPASTSATPGATPGTTPGTSATTSEAAPGDTPAAAGSPFDSIMGFMPMILIFAIMYFVLIGPERKQRKKREEMLKALGKGDSVITTGGLHGTIASISDTQVTLQVDEGVRLKFNRSAIADIVKS